MKKKYIGESRVFARNM